MNDKNAPRNITYYSEIEKIVFYILGDNENLIDSNVHISNSEVMKTNKPAIEGVYDSRMGTTDHSWSCQTCGNYKGICPGHFGSITLKYPVKNPLFRNDILRWLKIICVKCGNIVVKAKIQEGKKMDEYTKLAKKVTACEHCGTPHRKVVQDKLNPIRFLTVMDEKKKDSATHLELFNHEIEHILSRIPLHVLQELNVPRECAPSNFILRTIRAPPNTIRPDMRRSGSSKANISDITACLKTLVEYNKNIPDEIPRREQIINTLADLYLNIDTQYQAMIKTGGGATKLATNTNKAPNTIMERWTGKQGRIRKNLMGKRTSYMIRSVITGNPKLKIDEIGISRTHAMNIEIPEVVYDYNRDRLSIYFANRNKRYPGCKHIIKKADGCMYRIDPIDPNYQLQNGDIVFRDVIDGDLLCFNRQPSLTFASIAGFRAKIIEGDTIEINPMACKGFNADFDGDSCNVIITQNIESKAEIEYLSLYDKWFISPQTRAPVTGSFQDGLIGLMEMSKEGIKLDKWHAMQAFSDVFSIAPDFEKKEYEGREIISLLLPEINISSRNAEIYKPQFAEALKYHPKDIKVNIVRGNIKSGIIDKSTAGQAKANSIYHIIANEYGNARALDVCYNLTQLTDKFLLFHGFSTGIKDINISSDSMQKVKYKVAEMFLKSREITNKLNTQKLIAPINTSLSDYYEREQVAVLSPGDDFIIPILADIDINANMLARMILPGVKGNMSNFVSINAAIGGQSIGGKRFGPQVGWGRTSPYFARYDTEPNARGYVSMSYREGVMSDVFPFMSAETRHGAISNALMTSVTGAQNRISIKNLESIMVDNLRKSVKNQNIVQPLYGECGVDPARMEAVSLSTLMISDVDFEKNYQGPDQKEWAQLKSDRQYLRKIEAQLEDNNPKEYITNKTKFLPVNVERIIEDVINSYLDIATKGKVPKLNAGEVFQKVSDFCSDLPYIYLNQIQRDKRSEVPAHFVYATTLIQITVRAYLCYAQLVRRGITIEMLTVILQKIYYSMQKALIDPGTSVGIIAAQCLSEPMTQYILNSKHRVGGQGGTKTDTISRIRELLGAKDTKDMNMPSMMIMVRQEYEGDKIKVQEIANHIEMLQFSQFIITTHVFFEEYGKFHRRFAHEEKIVKIIEKNNYGSARPGDLAKWCIRFSINKEELYIKSIKLENIILAIRKNYPELYIIYTPENADEIFIRCYIKNNMVRASTKNYLGDVVMKYVANIKNVILRGVDGIFSTEIVEVIKNTPSEDGSLSSAKKIYAISTSGTNLVKILENPFIDPYRTHSDSPMEIASVFGIVAARNKIVNEFINIMQTAHHIHCNVFADEMVYTGVITSIQNTGLQKRENANVTLRLAFMKPTQVIQSAALKGQIDRINGVSGALIIGATPQVGTMYNSVIVNESFIAANVKTAKQTIEEL